MTLTGQIVIERFGPRFKQLGKKMVMIPLDVTMTARITPEAVERQLVDLLNKGRNDDLLNKGRGKGVDEDDFELITSITAEKRLIEDDEKFSLKLEGAEGEKEGLFSFSYQGYHPGFHQGCQGKGQQHDLQAHHVGQNQNQGPHQSHPHQSHHTDQHHIHGSSSSSSSGLVVGRRDAIGLPPSDLALVIIEIIKHVSKTYQGFYPLGTRHVMRNCYNGAGLLSRSGFVGSQHNHNSTRDNNTRDNSWFFRASSIVREKILEDICCINEERTRVENSISQMNGSVKSTILTRQQDEKMLTEINKCDPLSGRGATYQHDSCAILFALFPDLFTARYMNVRVECGSELCSGQTVVEAFRVDDDLSCFVDLEGKDEGEMNKDREMNNSFMDSCMDGFADSCGEEVGGVGGGVGSDGVGGNCAEIDGIENDTNIIVAEQMDVEMFQMVLLTAFRERSINEGFLWRGRY